VVGAEAFLADAGDAAMVGLVEDSVFFFAAKLGSLRSSSALKRATSAAAATAEASVEGDADWTAFVVLGFTRTSSSLSDRNHHAPNPKIARATNGKAKRLARCANWLESAWDLDDLDFGFGSGFSNTDLDPVRCCDGGLAGDGFAVFCSISN
jgi:hypothetical protein